MNSIKKLGIVAGSGNLPLSIIRECKLKKIKPFVAVLADFANESDYKNLDHISVKYGDVGKTISFFRDNGVSRIVFAGAVKKPDLRTIWPDRKGFSLLGQLLKSKIFGDDTILQTSIKFLEKEGFTILPVDSVMGDIKIGEGISGSVQLPSKDYLDDIELGVKVLKQMGDLDIGQSIVIQNGIVVGIECIEGTEKLIERCGALRYKTGRKPILIKIKKTSQTRKIDLPAIGVDTVKQVKAAGFAGIAMDSKNGLVIDKKDVISLANREKVFVYGI